MSIEDFFTGLTCANDKGNLLRVPQALYRIMETEPNTSIVCANCGAVGRYEEVIKQGAGLISGLLTQEQRAEVIKKLSIAPHTP